MESSSYASHMLSDCGCHWSATGEMKCGNGNGNTDGNRKRVDMMQREHDLLFDAPSESSADISTEEGHAFVLHQGHVPVTFEHDANTQKYKRYLQDNALFVGHVPFDKKVMSQMTEKGKCGFCSSGGGDEGTSRDSKKESDNESTNTGRWTGISETPPEVAPVDFRM